jgi:hypothetical protein
MYRRALLLIMAVVLPASALVGAFPQTVKAADTPTPYLAPAALDAAKKSTERNSLAMCLGYRFGGAIKNSNYGYDIDPKDIASGSWFSDYTQVRQWSDYNNGDDGTNCDKINTGSVLQDLGFTGGNIQAACELGIKRQNNSDCVNGTGNMRYAGSGKQDVLNRIDKTYKGTSFGKDYSAEQYYVMAMSIITNDKTCKSSPLALGSTATADQKAQADATITVVGSDGVATQVLYKFNGNKGTSWSFRNKSGGNTDYIAEKCGELAKIANDNANAYSKWVGANQPGSAGNPGTCEQYAALQVGGDVHAKGDQKDLYSKLLTACNDGLANKSTPNYCKRYTAKNENDACLYGFGTALASTPTGNTTDTPTADDKPTCGIQGIGWLVCPAMTFMAKIADVAYDFIASYFLTIDPKIISNDQTKAAWDQFRNVANVMFVIALLFIIYSQVTSFGISNYGIKRMLPRILVAALLVNLSYYICSAAVDLSNLLGYAIPQFFKAIPIGAGLPDGGGAAKAVGWVAVIGTLIVGAIGIALAVSIPVLLAALLAIALIVLMLIARQALVVLLIVVSPLAFAAYLLPNTEQWFKKWYKMLFTLLMLFPIIGAVFGASALASQIIAAAGAAGGGQITQVIALGVSAIPFFVVPGLLKGSLNAAGAIGGKFQGIANKATGKMGSQVKNTSRLGAGMADMKRFRDQQRQIKLAKGRGESRSALGAVGRVVGGKKYNERARLHAEGLENKEYEEDVRAAGEYQARHTSFDQKKAIAAGEVESSEAERDAAIRFMMEAGNFNERRAVLESVGSMSGGLRRSAINGARKKGDTGVYGSSTLGQLEDSTSDGSPSKMSVSEAQAALSAGAVKRINDGEVTPEVFSRDSYTAGYVAEQSKSASGAAQTQLAQSLTNYAASDQGKKTAAALQGHIDTVVNNAPAGSVQPAPATPIAPAGQQPTPQPQNTTTLTIPHGGGNPPTTPPPQAPPPGMTQRASGLFVPTNMNNGGNNTPPPPPPSNP